MYIGVHNNCVPSIPISSCVIDTVNHPPHYKQVPGVECIEVTEHFSFLRGNAIKYLWRAGAKGDELEDLKKARWYLDREIASIVKSRVGGTDA